MLYQLPVDKYKGATSTHITTDMACSRRVSWKFAYSMMNLHIPQASKIKLIFILRRHIYAANCKWYSFNKSDSYPISKTMKWPGVNRPSVKVRLRSSWKTTCLVPLKTIFKQHLPKSMTTPKTLPIPLPNCASPLTHTNTVVGDASMTQWEKVQAVI